jgi:SAM-dependent methyltransferase
MVDVIYTYNDHAFREHDAYARGKYDITLRWLSSRSARGRKLFNVGCGNGLFNQLATDQGYRVEACEPDPDAALIAKRTAPDGVVIHPCDLFGLPVDEPADVVVMHDVLEHIDDDRAAAGRLRELIVPGGVLVLSVPGLPFLFGRHDELLGHHRRYLKPSLRSALEPHFRIDRLRYYGMSLVPLTLWVSRIRRASYPTAAATSGFVGRVFDGVCRAEAAVPTPVGTSLMCLATARSA